jgi:ADP-ribose pyrophosphatase YjhB (NUDIX family)
MRKAVRAIIVRDNQTLVMHRNKFGQEYYTLLGGGIGVGETLEQALAREVLDESGQQVTSLHPVFIEEAGDPFGTQYIYLCEVSGGDPALAPTSDEAKINELGQNMFTPMWMPLDQFGTVSFRSPALQKAMLHGFVHGFPQQPVQLDSLYLDKLQATRPRKESNNNGT